MQYLPCRTGFIPSPQAIVQLCDNILIDGSCMCYVLCKGIMHMRYEGRIRWDTDEAINIDPNSKIITAV